LVIGLPLRLSLAGAFLLKPPRCESSGGKEWDWQ